MKSILAVILLVGAASTCAEAEPFQPQCDKPCVDCPQRFVCPDYLVRPVVIRQVIVRPEWPRDCPCCGQACPDQPRCNRFCCGPRFYRTPVRNTARVVVGGAVDIVRGTIRGAACGVHNARSRIWR